MRRRPSYLKGSNGSIAVSGQSAAPAVRRSHTVAMSPKQLRRLIKSARLTVQAAADELGLTNRQLYRYLSGDAEIPRVVELAVSWIVQSRRKS